ncbi:MAG TPA: nuclear transport factor 2 family protein [Burkholderiales bacterium]|nr:nuclear transport factor 2 family protein [Burkholderiales bacterium]
MDRFTEVSAALKPYFDGLYESDTRKLALIFHPAAIYACATSGELLRLNMDDYFKLVDKRPSPASRNEVRRDAIVSIEFAGPVTAFAHVKCAIGPKYFTDFLTLIHVDGRWQIIAKVFHYEE